MRAHLIAIGERMPAWVNDGYAEYVKRLSRDLPLQLVELSTKSRGAREPARAMADEGSAILAAIPKGAHVVALDSGGKPWSSEDLAAQLPVDRDAFIRTLHEYNEAAGDTAADMATLIIIGSSETRVIARQGRSPLVYTPRAVEDAMA